MRFTSCFDGELELFGLAISRGLDIYLANVDFNARFLVVSSSRSVGFFKSGLGLSLGR
jgi:hypothetical protein